MIQTCPIDDVPIGQINVCSRKEYVRHSLPRWAALENLPPRRIRYERAAFGRCKCRRRHQAKCASHSECGGRSCRMKTYIPDPTKSYRHIFARLNLTTDASRYRRTSGNQSDSYTPTSPTYPLLGQIRRTSLPEHTHDCVLRHTDRPQENVEPIPSQAAHAYFA